jgi:Flp pilus assembly protein TadB
MTVPMALGALAGLGLWCIVRAALARRLPLDAALAALSAPHHDAAAGNAGGVEGAARRVGAWIMSSTGSNLQWLATDLAVLERSEEVHLVQRMRTAAFYAALPLSVWLVTAVAGAPVVSPGLAGLAAAALAVGGWFLTDGQVRSRAKQRRVELDSALVSYLQLVSILLAGGAGIQQALHEAVEHGQGWPFQVLRRALTDARIRGISPWQAFDEHGAKLGLNSLVDLAATMELAGTSGAHIRESLVIKARALRSHQVAAIEREATSRTTAMTGPTGLMMAGFVVLVIYPAFQAVLNL